MPDVAKLRRKAAELELKKQFDKALAVYIEILDSYKHSDLDVDVALFNRVGDIHLKQGNVADAVDYYEKAVDHYVETGFYNNAIALCNKILRSSPGRASIYYKLGKISAQKGFKSDAKANFLEYADRMQKAGKTTEAFRALKEFADLCPDQDDIRLMLADQLTKLNRRDEAVEQLQLLYERYVLDGHDTEAQATIARMKAIDPEVQPRSPNKAPRRPTGDLVFLDLNDSAAANRRSALTRRATQGLDLLATGEQDEVPAPKAPAAAAPKAPAAPAPAAPKAPAAPPRAAAAPPKAPAPVPKAPAPAPVEPESLPEILDTDSIEPAVLDGVTRVADFERMDDNQQPGLLDGLQTTGVDDGSSFVNSGSILDLETTSFEGPPQGGGIGESADGLLDLDIMPGAGFGDASRPPSSGRAPLNDLPLLEDDAFASPAGEEESPIGGDLELIMPEDVDFSEAPHVAADESPAADIPLLDFDLPMPGEAMAAVTGTPNGAMEFGTLDLIEPAEQPEPADEAENEPEPEEARPQAQSDVVQPEEDTAAHPSTVMAAHSVELLQAMADSDPDDHAVRRRLGEAMLDAGDRDGGLHELETAMIGSERAEDLDAAASLADEIVRLNPSSVRHHQKRVEYAFRLNERGRLIEAYLELADALFRAGQVEKSRAIYQRVLDLAPDDVRAQTALESIPAAEAPAPAAKAPAAKGRHKGAAPARAAQSSAPTTRPEVPLAADDEFVNLGDWLRGDAGEKSTRLVVPEQEPTGDEEADFQDMLRKFKQGIAENVEDEDHQSHYDLGVAYKEMGLLDEAIAEFQKALRAPANRVPTYEALGQCFIEKEQYPMAATILSRALTEKDVTEDNLIGVLYLLGRCAEERQQPEAALEYYQRVFVVDIQFRDISDRMAAVESGRS
jgi:tetratricopeptide (TPR) repeat protein